MKIIICTIAFFLFSSPFVIAQDTTSGGYIVPKKKKIGKIKQIVPKEREGIRTLNIGGKAQLDLRQESRTIKPPTYTMETMVVTSERVENKLAFTTNSSSLFTSTDILSIPSNRFSDVLNNIPGFIVLKKDGLGNNSVTTMRGFYGGGESDYVLFYVDGMKMNDLENGAIDWNSISPYDIAKMEILRGPASALYGDVGLGGVINVTTKEEKVSTGVASMSAGSFGGRELNLRTSGKVQDVPYRLSFQSSATDGFRKHSGWGNSTLSGDVTTSLNANSKLQWSFSNRTTNFDDPGPLTPADLLNDREGTNINYGSDGKIENRFNGRVNYSTTLFERADFRAGFYTQQRTANTIGTIPLLDTALTIFYNTKEREVQSGVFGIDATAIVEDTIEDIPNKFIFGLELETGKLQSTYFTYDGLTDSRTGWSSYGVGKRHHVGMFVHDEVPITPKVKLNGGFRFDSYNDSYDVNSASASHTSVTPKVGANYLFATELENDIPVYTGNVYGNISRAFKAPTLDQLFDQRLPISNPKLKPQNGWNLEAGVYQRGRIIEKKMYGEMVTSFYFIPMTDEIDYDVATSKYANITNSQHLGIENGFKLHWVPNITAFLNYTFTSVTFSSGTFSGNQLKGIPRHSLAFGATYRHRTNVSGTLTWNYTGDRYYDDKNSESLSGFHTLNMRISYKRDFLRGFVDFENILGAKFNSFGYEFGGTKFAYSSAPTSIRLGVEATFDTPWFSK